MLAREAEIGQSPDEVLELRLPPRPGAPDQARRPRLGAIAAYREVINAAPEHQATLEALEGALRERRPSRPKSARSSSRSIARWASGRSSRKSTRRSSRTRSGQEERLARVLPARGAVRGEAARPGQDARGLHPGAQGVPARRESGRGSAAARRRASTAAGRRSRTPTRTSSALHTEPGVQRAIGRRLARTFEDELGDIGKAEETYKYVLSVDAAGRRSPREPGPDLPVARVVA